MSFFPPYILFKSLIKKGSLDVTDADGRWHTFSGTPGRHVAIRLHDTSDYWKFLYNPQLYVPEAYMFGRLTIEKGSLDDFLTLLAENYPSIRGFSASKFHTRLRYLLKRVWQNNSLAMARKNITHHYDISNELYTLFLDKDMQYSCAYFRDENETLEQAQQDKKNHIIAKLRLKPGMRVLDIGCGWGGLGIEMARRGVHVTGVTLSTEQHELANERAKAAGVADRAQFKLLDYRKLEGTFDRIVSVGMFEHVGIPHYPEFFGKVYEMLDPDGIALLHTIGYDRPSLSTHPWLEKYIFRNGYLPALSEFIPFIERAGFWITDVEPLRLHYAYTLREWKKRFRSHLDKIRAMYDDTFCRMFDLYLTGCEIAMIYAGTEVFQVQMSKKIDAVPLTRDYMYQREEAAQAAMRA